MELGFFAAHEEYSPTELLAMVEHVDEAGFDTVWTSDHIHPWWHTGAECGSAWPWMGSALERTTSVRMGTGVTPPINRYHPGMIAQQFATLAAMYPGRVHCALGTGEAMNEMPLGYDFPAYEERRKRLIDACEIITRLWDGGFHDYEGHYWRIDTAKLYTLPTERVPLYLAANGPRSAKVAGRYADGLLTIQDPETFRSKLVPALEAGAEEAGRDPDEITRIKQGFVSYADDYDEALQSVGFWRGPQAIGFDQPIFDPRVIEEEGSKISLEEMTDAYLVTTDPGEVREYVERLREAGFDEVEIHSASPDQHAYIEMMAAEVIGDV